MTSSGGDPFDVYHRTYSFFLVFIPKKLLSIELFSLIEVLSIDSAT